MVIYLGLFVQLHCGEGRTLQTNITGIILQTNITCSVWATLGLPVFRACVPSWSTLFRLQVALLGNCLRWALGCPHFPDLYHSGSGSRVLPQRHRLSWACVLCPSQVPAAQATMCLVNTLSQLGSASYRLPSPSPFVSWVCHKSSVSGMQCVSSGELISDCDPPGRCQLSRIPGKLR